MKYYSTITLIYDDETGLTRPADSNLDYIERAEWRSIARDVDEFFSKYKREERWLRDLIEKGLAIVPDSGFNISPRSKAGFVYLFYINGQHKIGFTRHPHDRFHHLAGQSGKSEIEFVWWHPQAFNAEQRILQLMAHRRIHGEWHTLTQGDIDRIRGLLAEETQS
jgi:hypothetical protein